MRIFRNLPVQHKLMAITMMATGVAVLMTCAAFIIYERATARQQMIQALDATAALSANLLTGSSLDVPARREQVLKFWSSQPEIVEACLYDQQGQPSARYLRKGVSRNPPPPVRPSAGGRFNDGMLELFHPVGGAGETAGTIYLVADSSRMTPPLGHYVLIGALALLVSGGVAFFLSAAMQSGVFKRLSDLAKTVGRVRTEKDYSVRVARRDEDDLGRLIDGFNEMLAQIQERDLHLEQRVAGRTRELAAAKNFLDQIINAVADPIFVKDRQHRGVLVNDAFCQLMGCAREQLIGKSDHDHKSYSTGEAAEFESKDEAVFETGRENINEEIFTDVGGQRHILNTKKRLYIDEKGAPFIVGVIRDVTESKRAEQALRESEANYYSLVDQMPAGLFRKDLEGRFIFVNSWFCRLRDAKPEDYLGKLPQEAAATALCQPGTQAAEMTSLFTAGVGHHSSILQTGRQIEVEETYYKPDGKSIQHHVVKSPVFGPDGTIVGSQGFLLDITQRKRTEVELAYERDLLRTLLENSTDHIYFKDSQSRFIKASNSQARQFGVASGDELVGKSDFDFFSEEHARPAFEDEQQIIRTGQPIIGRIERETWKDGRAESWVLTTKMPLRNKAGEIIGTFGISKDITPIKEAEARLEQAHQQLLETSRLAGMAEVATSVLHNVGNVLNSVNVSTTLALDLVKQSRFNQFVRLAALIHEQRGHLAAFFTTDPRGSQLPEYLTKLADHLTAERAELLAELELARKNVEHIKDIVAMQQNYAKVSGVVEKVHATELVEDALRMNTGSLLRHNVQVVRDYPPDVIECNIERHKALQILINLIQNAKHACDESERPDKQLTLQVRTTGGRVQISVLDNGVGIAAENMTRIFNHGFTTRIAGHGFGLHSGALAAKELGGTLTAHSGGPGAGATFVLDLPLQPPSNS